MGAAYFYHLTESPLEVALPLLIERARSAGWRVELRGPDGATMERLDRALWLGAEDGFLPHGLAGGPHDARQPVLLTHAGQGASAAADCVMSLGGAAIGPEEAAAAARVCILFDGADPAAVERARAQWRELSAAGIDAVYWAQEGGRWAKKAETRPAGG